MRLAPVALCNPSRSRNRISVATALFFHPCYRYTVPLAPFYSNVSEVLLVSPWAGSSAIGANTGSGINSQNSRVMLCARKTISRAITDHLPRRNNLSVFNDEREDNCCIASVAIARGDLIILYAFPLLYPLIV